MTGIAPVCNKVPKLILHIIDIFKNLFSQEKYQKRKKKNFNLLEFLQKFYNSIIPTYKIRFCL